MGVPRTLAKGLSKLKEAAELRKLGGTQAERMARAAEQEWNIDNTLYHLTPSDITEFKLNADPTSHTGGGAVWLRRNPHSNVSAHQVSNAREVYVSGANDMPLVIPSEGRLHDDTVWELQREGKLSRQFPYRVSMDENKTLRELGYKYYDDGRNEIAVFNPSDIRSVNADFNPEYRDSPNLLAGIAGAMPYAGATAALLAGAAPKEAEAGALQTLGRAAPYLTSAALGGAAALQSPDAESFVTQPAIDPSYEAYIRDEMEARTAADKFAQMRGSKAGYWEARRQELLDMVNGLGEMANNVVLPALDKPLQGYLGLAGTAGALAQGHGLEQALMQGANIARQPSDQTTYNMGGAVTDTLSPYTTPEAAAAAGALTNAGIQMLSPI